LEALKVEWSAEILSKIAQQQPPAIDPNIEARLDAMEAVLAGKS
jgi:hypothetical protein